MTGTNYKDVREWGNVGTGISDSQPVMQQAINDCIANSYRKLYIPSNGIYQISAPLILCNFYSGNYTGFTLEIFGDGDMWDSGFASYIKANFTDRFIIGIQHGKGVTIRGLALSGQFVTPNKSNIDYYKLSFDQYTDGICRDSRYSPYSAIVIDPFTRGGVPADGGYPGLALYYRGTGGQSGSTDTTIDNCILEKTVVGVCSSPNGMTRNAEITQITNTQFRYNKLCVSGGQDQEKTNSIYNCACWYDSHTFFATGKYGFGSAGNWNIDKLNLASRMVQFIDNNQQGYYPTYIKNVFAENLGRWGYLHNNSSIVSTVRDCTINFAQPENAGLPVLISGDGSVYDGCTFRHYGNSIPIRIAGESIFNKCVFSGHPVFEGLYWYPRFIDCRANGAFLGLTGIKTFGGGSRVSAYGNYTLASYNSDYELRGGNDRGQQALIRGESTDIYMSFNEQLLPVTITGNSFSFTAVDASLYAVGIAVRALASTGTYFAIITNISATKAVTASYVDSSMVSGVYYIQPLYPIYFCGILMGDIVSGSNQITNCKCAAMWWYGLVQMIGFVIKNPYGGTKYIKITSVSGTTATFYGTIQTTRVGAIFGNYSQQEIGSDYLGVDPFPANFIVRKNDKVIAMRNSENSKVYKVTKGGWLKAPADDTGRAAILKLEDDIILP